MAVRARRPQYYPKYFRARTGLWRQWLCYRRSAGRPLSSAYRALTM